MVKKQSRFKLKEVGINEIVYVSKNARYMEQTTFMQLVSNIRKDGQLSSVPFTVLLESGKNAGKYEVISGNHRVKAAKQAGITRLWVMYCEESLISNDEKRAIQLSHNSIAGKDDLEILKDLVDEITSADYKEYAHIDESVFDELDSVDFDIIQPTNEVVTVTFTFFDVDKVNFGSLCEELDAYTPQQLESLSLFPIEKFKEFNKIVGSVQEKYKVKSYGLAVSKIMELAKMKLNELS